MCIQIAKRDLKPTSHVKADTSNNYTPFTSSVFKSTLFKMDPKDINLGREFKQTRLLGQATRGAINAGAELS